MNGLWALKPYCLGLWTLRVGLGSTAERPGAAVGDLALRNGLGTPHPGTLNLAIPGVQGLGLQGLGGLGFRVVGLRFRV